MLRSCRSPARAGRLPEKRIRPNYRSRGRPCGDGCGGCTGVHSGQCRRGKRLRWPGRTPPATSACDKRWCSRYGRLFSAPGGGVRRWKDGHGFRGKRAEWNRAGRSASGRHPLGACEGSPGLRGPSGGRWWADHRCDSAAWRGKLSAMEQGQDTIRHVENEIHFQRQAGRGGVQYNQRFLMSTLAEISTPTSRRSPKRRILLWLVLAMLLILAGALAYAYYVAHSALPQLDGRLQVGGLSAPVTVTRDGHGVPTIEAASLEDLFFAQGYVTAQDRLWQMDVMRRYGSGELSEILGADTLKLDREQRILDFPPVRSAAGGARPRGGGSLHLPGAAGTRRWVTVPGPGERYAAGF